MSQFNYGGSGAGWSTLAKCPKQFPQGLDICTTLTKKSTYRQKYCLKLNCSPLYAVTYHTRLLPKTSEIMNLNKQIFEIILNGTAFLIQRKQKYKTTNDRFKIQEVMLIREAILM